MGGIRPETRAMKRHKVAKKEARRLKKITPNNLGIPPKANLLRAEIRHALAQTRQD
jgi:hypothetical protein